MWDTIITSYGYCVIFYSILLILSYITLLILAYSHASNFMKWSDEHIYSIFTTSPFVPGVSIVASAFNEEVTIVDNVNSLLRQEYPDFEVIIVNDGSRDHTLDKLIENFDLDEVPYEYVERVHCRPFRRLFRSHNPKFSRLTVVDKVNGGTKADAVNGGLNVVRTPYFINTDVDCILSHSAITHCIFPILNDDRVIAVSGTMSMSNGATVEDGEIVDISPSSRPIPLFQDLEYKRSFLVGKMGWSRINAMNNVSGGYGLFSTEVVINAGGYTSDSFAEDMDMLTRMVGYCCEQNRPYRVVQIPHTCCWTEGPGNVKVLKRQRVRWGRGLLQHMVKHRYMIFNPRYKRMGMITMPYTLLFELCAPIIEALGMITLIYLIIIQGVNWETFWVMFGAIYLFNIMLSSFVVFYDFLAGGSYNKRSGYFKLLLASLCEPFVYHPMIVYFSLKGYWDYIRGTTAVWGEMTRTGTKKK